MAEAVDFGALVLHHWIALLTGGVLALVVFLIDKLTDWRLPKWLYVFVVTGGLVVSAFQAWQGERAKVAEANARADQLKAKLDAIPRPSMATPRQPRQNDQKPQYRRRLLLAEGELIRRIKPAELEWVEQKDAKFREYLRRIRTEGTEATRAAKDEYEAYRAAGPLVALGDIYPDVRKLMDELAIDLGANTSSADRWLESPKTSARRYSVPTVKALAGELHALAEARGIKGGP